MHFGAALRQFQAVETGREKKMIKEPRFFRLGVMVLLASAGLAFSGGSAWAQGDQHLPLDKAVMSGEAAKKSLTKYQISADVARKLVDACVDYAKSTNTPVSVFVLSPDGEIVDAHRMDGQNSINTDTALLKAKTALYLRDSTHIAANRFRTLDARLIREDLHMYLVSGGLPIVVDDQMIGAIGVGGGNADEQCGYQALIKVLGPQPPLAPNMPPDPLGESGGPGGGGGGGRGGAAPQGGGR
jgi:glc operon protein GlcG